ncbi:MAG: hypothetical protein JXQ87_11965 [Bacteroidia bacterium]
MKKVLPYLLLLLTTSSFAQIKTFKDLALPDVELHQFILSSDFSYRSNSLNPGYNLEFPINLRLNGYKNYRYRQTFYNVYIGNELYVQNISRAINSTGTGFSIDHTRYNNKYFFFRIWNNSSFSNNYRITDNEDGFTTYRRTFASNRTSISIGRGRLEPIDWAIRAGFMNEALKKSGAISNDIPEDVLLKLARTMAVEDRSRFFEPRFYNIRRIKSLDSVMAKNSIAINALEYYTTLNDQYFFAPRRNVLSGSRIEFVINQNAENDYRFRVSDSLDNIDQTLQALQYFATLRYEYHLPVNLHLHQQLSISLSYGDALVNRTINYPNDVNVASGFAQNSNLAAAYQLQWFPSTRTSLNWRTNGRYALFTDNQSIGFNTGITLDVFINRRLQYQIGGSFNLSRLQDQSGTVELNHNLSLFGRFAYQIF